MLGYKPSYEPHPKLRYTISSVQNITSIDVDDLPYSVNKKGLPLFFGATVGGLLFGYDTGVISGVLLYIQPQDIKLNLITDLQKELITSITCAGSFVGSVVAYPIGNYYGRKLTLVICCLIFIMASLLMSLSTNLKMLITGRFIVGIAIGFAGQSIPVYLSEIAPKNIKGTVLTFNTISITAGQLFAYIVSLLTSNWRYLFAIGMFPAIGFILILDLIPESPRWLITNGMLKDAESCLKHIYPMATSGQIQSKLLKIAYDMEAPTLYKNRSCSSTNNISQPENLPLISHEIFKGENNIRLTPRSALLVGCILMFFQQIIGFNTFMYYSAIMFNNLGVHNPILSSCTVAGINFIFTFIPVKFIDVYGRRWLLLNTIWIMTIGLILCSIGFQYNNVPILLASIVIYVAGYASGMGSIPWNSIEFLPPNKRLIGGTYISCTNWLSNFLVSLSYLSLIAYLGNKKIMLFFAIITILNWIFVFIWYPETENLDRAFSNGINIH